MLGSPFDGRGWSSPTLEIEQPVCQRVSRSGQAGPWPRRDSSPVGLAQRYHERNRRIWTQPSRTRSRALGDPVRMTTKRNHPKRSALLAVAALLAAAGCHTPASSHPVYGPTPTETPEPVLVPLSA